MLNQLKPTKAMNHTTYPKSLRKHSVRCLRFIAKDAQRAIDAMPDNPNNGYYADEINYCCNEIQRRRNAKMAIAGQHVSTRNH